MASASFPAWELPNWALRLVIVLLLIGFPIALILAWAFDVTAQGIRTTPSVAAPRAHRRRNVILLVATGVIISAAAGFFLLPRVSAHKIDKSIAVLPFENLSAEKENAFFADGVQDDILTALSKIADLKVISRTSTISYRAGAARNLRAIAQELMKTAKAHETDLVRNLGLDQIRALKAALREIFARKTPSVPAYPGRAAMK